MAQLSFLNNVKSKGREGFKTVIEKNPSLTEEERRKLELEYLKPKKNQDPTKERTFKKPHQRVNVETYLHKILVYFHKEEDYHLFRKFVKVNDYIEVNTYDTKLITALFRAIDRGDLSVTKEGEIEIKLGDDMRTLPCKICGKPYTDNITEKVDPKRGGYIICARCSMKDPRVEVKKEEPKEEGKRVWKKKV